MSLHQLLQQQPCPHPHSKLGHHKDAWTRWAGVTLPSSLGVVRTRMQGKHPLGFQHSHGRRSTGAAPGRELDQCLFHFNHQVPN